jgi:hypothetical protein
VKKQKTVKATKAAKTVKAKPKARQREGEPPPTPAEIKAWRAASQDVDVTLEILTNHGIQTAGATTAIPMGRWFAAVPIVPAVRRYQFVLQWQGTSRKFVLCHLVDGAGAQRLPPSNGWMRALDTGRVHVIASDLQLTRRQIAAMIGGHEPPAGMVKPPNT